jgi:hypothetical protein
VTWDADAFISLGVIVAGVAIMAVAAWLYTSETR